MVARVARFGYQSVEGWPDQIRPQLEREPTNDVLSPMQVSIPEQAVKMRTLAARLRDNAMCTGLPEYREKLAKTADELDAEARRMERRLRLAS